MNELFITIEAFGRRTYLNNSLRTWLVAVLILAVGVLLSRLLRSVLSKYGARLASFSKTDLDDRIVEGAVGPLAAMVILPAFHICIHILEMPQSLENLLGGALSVALALLITIIAVRSIDALFRVVLEPATQNDGPRFDAQFLAFGRKLLKALVVGLALLTVMNQIGLDIMSLITGLGIGGLAVALAAQETLGNMLGSLQIMTDKPFTLGDFIRFNGTFGRVEEIGLRSTKILTSTGIRAVIPNKLVAGGEIDNCSVYEGITVETTISLTYGTTADELEKATALLQQIISEHEATDKEMRVHFINFGAFSLDLRAVYFINDFSCFLSTQHEINLEIKRRFDAEGLNFAFPTQTLHLMGLHPKS